MLTRSSPQVSVVPQAQLELKAHQKAMVQKCLDFEKDAATFPYGVVNTPVGSGKTFVMLSLPLLDKHRPTTGNSVWSNIFGKETSREKISGATMIVVPSHLFSQWQDAIKKFLGSADGPSGLKVKAFSKYADVINIYQKKDALRDADVFLVSSLYFNAVATSIKTMEINIRRIVFDELDNMAEMVKEMPAASFYWFVSATIGSMLKEDHTGHVNMGDKPMLLAKLLTNQIRVDTDFIREGFSLPAIQNEAIIVPNMPVKAFSAIANHVYRKFNEGKEARDQIKLDMGIVSALNACDGKTAFLSAKYADITPAPTKNDAHLFEQIKKAWSDAATKMEDTLTDMKKSLDDEGFEREEDSIRRMEKHLDILKLHNEGAGLWEPGPTDLGADERPKMKRLYLLLQELVKQGRKIILFSEYPRVYNEITDFMKAKSIGYTDLDAGNEKAMGQAIAKYKEGDASVLLLYSAMFSCGTNLENTTDIILLHKVDKHIEDQIIGRGQRPGRTGPLRVFRLLHENEK